jgi:hypothetical protein
MFLPRATPLALTPERLLGLRVSLNTPVVSTEEVAPGPARAALAVHQDSAGRPTVTLAVRPVDSSGVVFYGLEEDLPGDAMLSVGVDAALSFGESLGFLFDDDTLQGGGRGARERAFALWCSVAGPPPESAAGVPEADAAAEELLLEDLVEEAEAAPPAAAPALTKFRGAVGGETAPAPAPRRRALLARVRLIKRSAPREPEEGAGEPEIGEGDPLLRLLSDF